MPIIGAFLVEMAPIEDERGWFARTWCAEEFAAQGLASQLAQCSVSFNRRKGTLRGMHFQASPHCEAKLVRCSQGSLFDVLIDLRPDSKTYRKWISVNLSAADNQMVYVPGGLAHGYQTLEDSTEVVYQISASYHADSARGVRWDDPVFGINWPLEFPVLSQRDTTYPDFKEPIAR